MKRDDHLRKDAGHRQEKHEKADAPNVYNEEVKATHDFLGGGPWVPQVTVSVGRSKHMKDLTPQQIVRELDRYIVGQSEAKRAVAIALRNRYRRLALPPELQAEITPKNILMIGPTGVGKTEIARRLAKLADAPFVKVEATKFTQVGYVGRDVESIIRDLMDASVAMAHDQRVNEVTERAAKSAEERIIDILTEKVVAEEAERAAKGESAEKAERAEKAEATPARAA